MEINLRNETAEIINRMCFTNQFTIVDSSDKCLLTMASNEILLMMSWKSLKESSKTWEPASKVHILIKQKGRQGESNYQTSQQEEKIHVRYLSLFEGEVKSERQEQLKLQAKKLFSFHTIW